MIRFPKGAVPESLPAVRRVAAVDGRLQPAEGGPGAVDILVESGADAKGVLADGLVRVNGEPEVRRGRQLSVGDVVEIDGESARVTRA